jgi:hypothetical protein
VALGRRSDATTQVCEPRTLGFEDRDGGVESGHRTSTDATDFDDDEATRQVVYDVRGRCTRGCDDDGESDVTDLGGGVR